MRNVWINNRVEKIKEMVPHSRWFFVPTRLNLADIGTHPVFLENIDLDFLVEMSTVFLGDCDCKDWPSQTFLLSEKEAKLEERVAKTSIFSAVVESKGIREVLNCSKFSSLDKLLRIISYFVRFIFNLRTKQKNSNDYSSGDLSTEEIVISKEHWLKYEQFFIANSDKYEKVKNSLKLHYDGKTILRLNTRISNVENFNLDKKFPILLRNDSHFTQLVILKLHEEHYRYEINSTLAFIRYNYWIVIVIIIIIIVIIIIVIIIIIHGRQTVEIFLKNCVICNIVQGQTALSPGTPKLPEFRLLCNNTFENIGLDYAGPLYFKECVVIYVRCNSSSLLRTYT